MKEVIIKVGIKVPEYITSEEVSNWLEFQLGVEKSIHVSNSLFHRKAEDMAPSMRVFGTSEE